MIDTERAEIELKNSLSKLRLYLRKIGKQKEQGTLSRAERKLASVFHYDLTMITREATEMLRR